MVKLKLCFLNKLLPTIFTTNDIESDNGERLQIALMDVTDDYNHKIVGAAHPLSSLLVEVVVLDGEFDGERAHWSVEDFERGIVTPRLGGRPYLDGNDKRIRLKNGVLWINNLSFIINSKRTRTGSFRLGVKVIDDEILGNNNYLRIREAVSNSFKVMEHRSKGTYYPTQISSLSHSLFILYIYIYSMCNSPSLFPFELPSRVVKGFHTFIRWPSVFAATRSFLQSNPSLGPRVLTGTPSHVYPLRGTASSLAHNPMSGSDTICNGLGLLLVDIVSFSNRCRTATKSTPL